MGASASSTVAVSEILKDTVTNILISSSNSCSSTNINTQTLNISDIETVGCNVNIRRVSQNMDVKTNFNCAQDNNNSSDLQNKLKDALKSNIETKASAGLGLAASSTVIDQKSYEKVVNNVNMTSIAECVATNLNTQLQNIGKIKMTCYKGGELNIEDLTQSMVSSAVNSCIQSNQTLQQAITELQTDIDTTAKTTSEGMFAGLGGGFILMILVVVIIGGAYQSGMLDSGDDDDNGKGSRKGKNFMNKFKNFKRR